LGLALHNYHDAHGQFPPGWCAASFSVTNGGWGWGTMLLPYMDEAAIYNAANFAMQPGAATNATARVQAMNQYICPSDRNAEAKAFGNTNGAPNCSDSNPAVCTVGVSSYVACSGTHHLDDYSPAGSGIDGLFGLNSRVRIRDVRDGTSNTLMAGERRP